MLSLFVSSTGNALCQTTHGKYTSDGMVSLTLKCCATPASRPSERCKTLWEMQDPLRDAKRFCEVQTFTQVAQNLMQNDTSLSGFGTFGFLGGLEGFVVGREALVRKGARSVFSAKDQSCKGTFRCV